MRSLLIFTFILLHANFLFAGNADPNNYFKNRKWTVDSGKDGFLHVENTYVAEPIHKPNKLDIYLQCPHSKKKVLVVKDYKYCGINAVTIIGKKVELLLVDFNSSDPRGYCTLRRKEYLPLPSCK